MRSNAYQAQLDKYNNWRELILSNDQNIEAFSLFSSGDLPERGSTQYQRLAMIQTNLWNINDGAYAAYQSELLAGNEWERIETSACTGYSNIKGTSLEYGVFYRVSANFIDYLEENCQSFIE